MSQIAWKMTKVILVALSFETKTFLLILQWSANAKKG